MSIRHSGIALWPPGGWVAVPDTPLMTSGNIVGMVTRPPLDPAKVGSSTRATTMSDRGRPLWA